MFVLEASCKRYRELTEKTDGLSFIHSHWEEMLQENTVLCVRLLLFFFMNTWLISEAHTHVKQKKGTSQECKYIYAFKQHTLPPCFVSYVSLIG